MSSHPTPHLEDIPTLTCTDDYKPWRTELNTYLAAFDCLEASRGIDSEPPPDVQEEKRHWLWEQRELMARTVLVATVSVDIAALVLGLSSAAEMYACVDKMFDPDPTPRVSTAGLCALLADMLALSLQPDCTVQDAEEHLRVFEAYMDRLTVPIDDELRALLFLQTVPRGVFQEMGELVLYRTEPLYWEECVRYYRIAIKIQHTMVHGAADNNSVGTAASMKTLLTEALASHKAPCARCSMVDQTEDRREEQNEGRISSQPLIAKSKRSKGRRGKPTTNGGSNGQANARTGSPAPTGKSVSSKAASVNTTAPSDMLSAVLAAPTTPPPKQTTPKKGRPPASSSLKTLTPTRPGTLIDTDGDLVHSNERLWLTFHPISIGRVDTSAPMTSPRRRGPLRAHFALTMTSHHVTRTLELLQDVRTLKDPLVLQVPGGNKMASLKVGTLVAKDDNGSEIVIEDVYYISSVARNLISQYALAEQCGCEVHYAEGTITHQDGRVTSPLTTAGLEYLRVRVEANVF